MHLATYSADDAGRMLAHYERSIGPRDHIDPEGRVLDMAPFGEPHRRFAELCEGLDIQARTRPLADLVVTMPAELADVDPVAFMGAAYEELEGRFGRDRVVCAYAHMDEPGARPHMHFAFVPVVETPVMTNDKTRPLCWTEKDQAKNPEHVAGRQKVDSNGTPRWERVPKLDEDGNPVMRRTATCSRLVSKEDMRRLHPEMEQALCRRLGVERVGLMLDQSDARRQLSAMGHEEYERATEAIRDARMRELDARASLGRAEGALKAEQKRLNQERQRADAHAARARTAAEEARAAKEVADAERNRADAYASQAKTAEQELAKAKELVATNEGQAQAWAEQAQTNKAQAQAWDQTRAANQAAAEQEQQRLESLRRSCGEQEAEIGRIDAAIAAAEQQQQQNQEVQQSVGGGPADPEQVPERPEPERGLRGLVHLAKREMASSGGLGERERAAKEEARELDGRERAAAEEAGRLEREIGVAERRVARAEVGNNELRAVYEDAAEKSLALDGAVERVGERIREVLERLTERLSELVRSMGLDALSERLERVFEQEGVSERTYGLYEAMEPVVGPDVAGPLADTKEYIDYTPGIEYNWRPPDEVEGLEQLPEQEIEYGIERDMDWGR